MGSANCRVMILVICILLLSFGSGRAYAIRSVGLALRRVLDGIVQELDKPLDIAPSPSVTYKHEFNASRAVATSIFSTLFFPYTLIVHLYQCGDSFEVLTSASRNQDKWIGFKTYRPSRRVLQRPLRFPLLSMRFASLPRRYRVIIMPFLNPSGGRGDSVHIISNL
ncbi:hypothetical protein Tco_0850097 [Tanacetum coccineum]